MSLVTGTNSKTLRGAKIVRSQELNSFVQEILIPEHISYSIVWVSGIGGIGKSVLLEQFREKSSEADFKDYCLTALVDERQSSPFRIMEAFAEQIRKAGYPLTKFEKELASYKEEAQKSHLQTEKQALRDKTSEAASALIGTIPVIGKPLQIVVNTITQIILFLIADRPQNRLKNSRRLEDPLGTLTQALNEELNRITMTPTASRGVIRCWRVILFFDTFEKIAPETVPWLLNHFLADSVSTNTVLVVAGRDPYDYSIDNAPKLWSKYRDSILSISLDSFTREETYDYLHKKGVKERNLFDEIWQLSRGFPLFLSSYSSSYLNPQKRVDPTQAVVDNFLYWLPKEDFIRRRLAVSAALLSRPFNRDDVLALKDLLGPEQDWPALYRWLIRQDFVLTTEDGRYSYNYLAQEFFCRYLYETSQSEYEKTRRVLAKYYQEQLVKIAQEKNRQVYDSPQWLELVLALGSQLFLLQDKASHTEAIERILYAYTHAMQTLEIDRFLDELSQKHPKRSINADVQSAVKTLRQRLGQAKYTRSRNQL